MIQNVVIEFTEQGIEDITDRLVKIGAIDAKQAADFKASNAAYKERQAIIDSTATSQAKVTSETNKSTKSMDDLANATKNAAANITNGATNEAIKKTSTLLDNVTKSFNDQSNSVKDQKAQIKDLELYIKSLQVEQSNAAPGKAQADYTKKIKESKFELEGLKSELDKLSKTNNESSKSTQTSVNSIQGLRKEYRALVAQAIEAGTTTPLGKDFLAQAAQVKQTLHQITQETSSLADKARETKALVEAVTAIGAGFQIAQGAQALFGDGSKDLQQQLVKIQATMALVNGLQTLQVQLTEQTQLRTQLYNLQLGARNVLEKIGITFKTQSNVAEGTGEAIKKRVIVVQAVENALTSESAIVRGLATAAQWLLNNAMLAFPLIAIIAGLGIVIGLLGGFSDGTKEATKSQIELNASQLEYLKQMQELDVFINQFSKDRQIQIQREIDLLTSQKASTDDIRAKEKELSEERQRNAQYQKGLLSQEIDNIGKNKLAVVGLQAAYDSLKASQAKAGSNSKDYDDAVKLAEEKLALAKGTLQLGLDAEKEASDSSLALERQRLLQINQIQLEGLAFQKTIIDSKLRFAKTASQDQLALQLASAKNEHDTQIANLKAANESTIDIEAQYQEKRIDLINAYNNAQLQKKIDLVNAELASTRIGSVTEAELKLKALDYQNQIELNNRKLTDEKKKQLVEKYIKDTGDIIYNASKKLRDDEINSQLLLNDAKLSVAYKGSAEEINLQIERLSLQERLELNNIDRNIQGTELGESKRLDIYTQYLEKRDAVELAATEKRINRLADENKRLNDVYQRQSDLEAANVNTTIQRKQELELQGFDNKQNQLKDDYNKEAALLAARGASQKEFDDLKLKYDDEYRLNTQARQNAADAIELENLKRKADIINQIGTELYNDATAINHQNLEAQLASYDRDTQANEENHKNKRVSDNAYLSNKLQIEKKIADAKRKAAQQEKELSIFQIILNTATAAMKSYAELGYPAGIAAAALVAGFGAVQLAIAANKPVPQFAKGTENAPEGWAWVGEKGPELVWMKQGSKVKTHEESKKMAEAATPTLRNTYFDKVDRSPIPSKQAQQAMAILAQNGMNIDIAALSKMIGNEVGTHLSKMPLTMMSFDKQGFQASVKEGNSINNFLDSRYSN